MKYEINTDALGRDIDVLEGQKQGLKQNLTELVTSMNTLNASWEGRAKNAYMVQYRADVNSMNNLCSLIEQYISILREAKREYERAANRVRGVVDQIRI